jgi:ABC-type amino acid transport system permease subunit
MDLYSGKPLTEIDPADLAIWFGLPGLVWFCWFFLGNLRMAWLSWRLKPAGLAAGVLAINALLLVVASMAGHVLTSGMLWIPWGMLNGALYLSLTQQESLHEA